MGLPSPRSLLTKAGVFPGKTTGAAGPQGLMRDLRATSLGQPLVRVGPKGEGGHLLPDNLAGITRCFSPEVTDCSVVEFTFLRRDRATPGGRAPIFPHPLDRVCAAGKPDLVLPRCWRAD